ncbi:MAG: hypothetical protein HON47_02590 [Candidatus Diapherotrites archaeon]|uniref:Uncharacterized protein n=1 Tax=Candidatus Iainarchaeum sp. TaxID=3101447 RepID=A0A8T5GEN0_9ARCH|nr:hypothetical protein [Candidatus Diapherotrites archaeon]
MEIDRDIPIGNSKTNLSNAGKKSIPKKPIFIGIGIIIIIAIIALLVMFVLPTLDFTPVIVDDTNVDTSTGPVELICEKRLNLNLGGVVAVFANGETKNTLISGKGTKTPYIQLYENKVLIETITNPYIDTNDAEDEIVALLKEKNVSNVSLAGASQELIKEFNENNLKCYEMGGEIAAFVGYDLPPEDISYCKKYEDQNLMGKVALGSQKEIDFSLISGKGPQAKNLLIYEDKNFIGPISNTASDINLEDPTNALDDVENDFISLIQTEGIEIIILASFGETLETKLNDNNIICYEAGGEIKSFMK